MKNMKRRVKYLDKKMNRFVVITIIMLIVCFCGCDKHDISQEAYTVKNKEKKLIKEITENITIGMHADEMFEELYSYKVEEKKFSFFTDETVYAIPYVRISGCPDTELEWKINHTLWKEACWIFDCADLENSFYKLFEGEEAIHISVVYKCGQYLSVVYEYGYITDLPGNIVYAIVIDMQTGERVVLSDMIQDREKMKSLLLHYFDEDNREIRLFINNDEDVEKILFYGEMTEAQTVLYKCASYHEEDGQVNSISYLFDAASFYMTEDSFVVLPGANYFEPLIFDWESVAEAIKCEKIIQ